MLLATGKLYRFDSVTELLAVCRARYATRAVATDSTREEFVLLVEPPVGERFESLIVHFEGEGCYAVMLPDVAAAVC